MQPTKKAGPSRPGLSRVDETLIYDSFPSSHRAASQPSEPGDEARGSDGSNRPTLRPSRSPAAVAPGSRPTARSSWRRPDQTGRGCAHRRPARHAGTPASPARSGKPSGARADLRHEPPAPHRPALARQPSTGRFHGRGCKFAIYLSSRAAASG